MEVLSARDVVRTYARGRVEVHALRGVSLTIEAGSYIAILGTSGSGKSTLLHQLGLLDRPTTGEILVEGKAVADLDDADLAVLRRSKLGFVFQLFQLLPGLRVWENVAMPGVLDGHRVPELRERADALLEQVGMSERSTHLPSELSGGEQQRVAVARALFSDPFAVLADEPTGALDSDTGRQVMDLLERSTVAEGKSLVVVTHDAGIADRASNVITMRDGLIV